MVQEKSPKDSVPDIAKKHHLDGYNTQKTIYNVYNKIKKQKQKVTAKINNNTGDLLFLSWKL